MADKTATVAGSWINTVTWNGDSVPQAGESVSLGTVEVTLSTETADILSLESTSAAGSLLMSTGGILNCTTITDARIIVDGVGCEINAVTINTSPGFYINVNLGKTVSGTGDIYAAGVGIMVASGTITSWSGNIYNLSSCDGVLVYGASNTLRGTITSWHGDIFNYNGGNGVYLSGFGTITSWYGNIYNMGSGTGLSTMNPGAGDNIDSWYGNIYNYSVGYGIRLDAVNGQTQVVREWYGDVYNFGPDASIGVLLASGVIIAWYGNIFNYGSSTGSDYSYGMYLFNGALISLYGDIMNFDLIGVGVYTGAGGIVFSAYSNVYSVGNSESFGGGIIPQSGGSVINGYGNVNSNYPGKGILENSVSSNWYTYVDCSASFAVFTPTISPSTINSAKLAEWQIYMFGGKFAWTPPESYWPSEWPTINGYLITSAAASRLPNYNGNIAGTIVDPSAVSENATGYPIGTQTLLITPDTGDVRKGTLFNARTGTLTGPVSIDVRNGVDYAINASDPAIPDTGTLNVNYAF